MVENRKVKSEPRRMAKEMITLIENIQKKFQEKSGIKPSQLDIQRWLVMELKKRPIYVR